MSSDQIPDSANRKTDDQIVAEESMNTTARRSLISVKRDEESKLLLDPVQTEEERRQRCRARQRCIRVNKVRYMYSLGVLNEASMQRIMEKHGSTLDRWLEESDISVHTVERTTQHEGKMKKKPNASIEQHPLEVRTRSTMEEEFITNGKTAPVTHERLHPFSSKVDSSNADLTAKTSTERGRRTTNLMDETGSRQPCCFSDVLVTHKVIQFRDR